MFIEVMASSFFHLPLDVQWSASFIHEELSRRNIDAVIHGFEIHITISSDRCKIWRERHQSKLDRRIALRRRDRPHLAIRHFPNRFLRNVELDRDPFEPPTESTMILAQASVLDLGALLVDSIETEFAIAAAHCDDHERLAQFRARIENANAEKERHIESLDFDAVALARDKELQIRDEIENFLLHGRAER